MKAIYKKEVKSYLTSMIGYVFIFFILLLEGIYFTAYNLQNAYPLFGTTLSAVTFIFLILVPVLTMKTIAEERKQKTDQLLLTAPVSVSEIVLGKFLAVATVYAIPVLIICLYPMIMGKYGTVSYAMAYTAVLGFALLGFAQIAVGVFWLIRYRKSGHCSSRNLYRTVCLLYDHGYRISDPGQFHGVSGVLYASGAAGCCVDIPYDPESVDRSSYRYRRRSGTCHHLCGKIHTI